MRSYVRSIYLNYMPMCITAIRIGELDSKYERNGVGLSEKPK